MSPSPRAAVAPASRRRSLVLLVVLAGCAAVFLLGRRPGTVTYRIGAVDARFGLSRLEVAEAVRSAADLWRSAAPGRELFREEARGDVEITLVYDRRQETLDRLKALHEGLDRTGDAIGALKVGYGGLWADYEQKRDILQDAAAGYERRVAAFNAEAARARRGQVPEDEARRLEAEREALGAELAALKVQEQELEARRVDLNASAETVNRMVAGQRAQAADYRAAGDGLKEAFDEGEYVRKLGSRRITVYSFASRAVLVRVLAHELGHALGLEHVNAEGALMYPLLQSDARELAPEDVAALKARLGAR